MPKYFRTITFVSIIIVLSAFYLKESPNLVAKIITNGIIDCFVEGLKNPDGSLVSCETSAAAFDGQYLILGSDKPVQVKDYSTVFSFPFSNEKITNNSPNYFTSHRLTDAVKIEDFTVTLDGQFIIGTTGFDRYDPKTPDQALYSVLFYWKKGHQRSAKVVEHDQIGNQQHSLKIRDKIRKQITSEKYPNGVPYFKIEGLACLPDNKLVFGIREFGENYSNFKYCAKLVAVSYKIKRGHLVLEDDYTLIYDFDLTKVTETNRRLGLSSIEYNKFNKQLFIMTSYEESENPEGVGGYLWSINLKDLKKQERPQIMIDESGNPLHLPNKAEGFTIISENKLFVIYDDDRVLKGDGIEQIARKTHQAAYSIIEILK